MKIIGSKPRPESEGEMTVIPEDMDDMWVIYNHVIPCDIVKATTTRKITLSNGKTTRKTIFVELYVTKSFHDTKVGSLQISGIIENEIEDIPKRAAHTLDVEPNHKLTIVKDEWNKLEIDDFVEATNVDNKAEIGAIIMEDGIAHVCVVTSNMTILKSKVEVTIPKKTAYETSIKKIDTAHEKFFSKLYQTLEIALPLATIKALLIASPAFYAQEFKKYLVETAESEGNREVLKFKDRIVVAHSSSGYLQSLKEVMKDPEVTKHLSSAKYNHQLKILENFYTVMNRDDSMAWYGPTHVAKAIDMGAIDTLLISDSLIRSHNIIQRKIYITLVEKVQSEGGKVEVFSGLHDAGQQLDDISGIAAILKFPLSDLEEYDERDFEDLN